MKGLAVFASLSCFAALASAQSLKAQVDASNVTVHKLMMAKDVKGFAKLLQANATPNFKYVEGGRTFDLKTMIQGMEMGLGGMKRMIRADSKAVSVHERGNKGTVTTLHTMVGTVVGQDKKPHTLSFTGTSTDSYVKQGGKWKMAKMAWGKQTMAMDGKPMPVGS